MYTAAITYSVNAGFVNRQMLFVVVIFPVGCIVCHRRLEDRTISDS